MDDENVILFTWKEHTVSKLEKLRPEKSHRKQMHFHIMKYLHTKEGNVFLKELCDVLFITKRKKPVEWLCADGDVFFFFITLAWLKAKYAIFPIE